MVFNKDKQELLRVVLVLLQHMSACVGKIIFFLIIFYLLLSFNIRFHGLRGVALAYSDLRKEGPERDI